MKYWYGIKDGDEIIVPAVSWSTTYAPLQQYGLHLKFVDIDRFTLNYDLESLSQAISDQTRAIMIVNLLGNSNDFDKIAEMTRNLNIILLEDNCEAMGANPQGGDSEMAACAPQVVRLGRQRQNNPAGGVGTSDPQ